MGQRTQLFVTAETDPTAFGGARRHRIGRHHHWRYGPNMVICAAQVVEHLEAARACRSYRPTAETAEGVAAIYGVNRATAESSGLGSQDNVSALDLAKCDNNCGCFLIHLTPEGYRFGFLIGPEIRGDLTTVTGVNGLMEAYGADWSQVPDDTATEDRAAAQTLAAAVATLRVGEAMDFLMDQDTATRATRAQLPGVTTHTV